jgi:hypothetical protein
VKKKKRFNSERAILAQIYQCQREANECLKQAEDNEAVAKEWMKHPDMVDSANLKLGEARRLRSRATRLTDTEAKKLGETLSEFRTTPMPFINDATVQSP